MAGRPKPTAGEAFRAEVTARWELTAPELLILDGTCAAVDRIDALEALVDRDGLMVPGSAGQLVMHPAVGEVRKHRALVARLVNQLRLPDEEGRPVASMTHGRAQRAAQARWARGAAS
jgi:hypothetical protein